MFEYIRTHWIAIFFAVLLGVAMCLPQIIAVEKLGGAFGGIYPTNNNDEHYYLARGQDVLDGHPRVAQPYLWEGKEREPLQFWIPDMLIAQLARVFHVPLHSLFTAMDFLLPAIAFLFTYAIGFLLSHRRTLALSLAIVMHFVVFLELLNRPVSPQFNVIFLLFFILAYVCWLNRSSWRNTLMLGLSLGLLFHVYAYYWTFAIVAIGLLWGGLSISRERDRLYKLSMSGIMALVIAIPYLLQLFQSFRYEFYQETIARVGMIETRMPSGIFIVVISSAVLTVLLFAYWKRIIPRDTHFTGLLALVAASPIAVNQHLITGENLEFSSHYLVGGVFAAGFGTLYLAGKLLEANQLRPIASRLARVLVVIVCIYAVSAAGLVVTKQSVIRSEEVQFQRYGPAIHWLNKNTEIDTVVYANAALSSIIPAYTHNNVWYAREANLHYMSNNEVIYRFLVQQYFASVFDREIILKNERAIWGTYYINRSAHEVQANKLRHVFGLPLLHVERYPESEIQKLIEEWNRLKTLPFHEVIVPYRLDYIIWDRDTNPDWDIEIRLPGMEKLFEANNVIIYRL